MVAAGRALTVRCRKYGMIEVRYCHMVAGWSTPVHRPFCHKGAARGSRGDARAARFAGFFLSTGSFMAGTVA